MEYDYTSAIRKRAELVQMAISALPSTLPQREQIAEKIIASYIRITPPSHKPPMFRMLTMDSMGKCGGSSHKPGNIFLNPKNLIEFIPDIVLTAAGIAGQRWVIPFAGLHILITLWKGSGIDLDKNHAMAIYAMWTHRDPKNRISEEDAYTRTNEHLISSGFPALNKTEFIKVIDTLCSIECIELDAGIIWLRERVKTTYE